MKISTIIAEAYEHGHLTETEVREWVSLNNRLERLESLSLSLSSGAVSPESGDLDTEMISDILGISQQRVSQIYRSGIIKTAKDFKEMGLDRHLLSKYHKT
jgi:hypothetical protein